MMRAGLIGLLTIAPLLSALRAAPAAAAALTWDATTKEYHARPGEAEKRFMFEVSNRSPQPITITEVKPSCGCTLVKLPPLPWRLAPGEKGEIDAKMDWAGRYGRFTKTIRVQTDTAPAEELTLDIHIPKPEGTLMLPLDRARNLQAALADRQAVFKNDCATCHAAPAAGKTGAELYSAACAICHDAKHRASMVPDLAVVGKADDAAYWKQWIAHGKAGSLMPAFAQGEGGPLTDAQIDSLAAYLSAIRRGKPASDANPLPVEP